MKAFLFVYSVAEYFEHLHKEHDWHGFDTTRAIAKYDKIIDDPMLYELMANAIAREPWIEQKPL